MIDRREILDAASTFQLLPNVVEKDYVLGWLLGGIDAHPDLSESWIFKGGTCLKKCYFETYRFSEDLDFTLRDESHLNQDFLQRALRDVVAWVTDQSGLTLPADQLAFDIYTTPQRRVFCQGKVGYRGPVSPTSGGWPKIKLDLTADEALVLPAVRREVFHPYSDRPSDGLWINCYAYEEAFGEKMRALGERTRPRDLYDVVNLYRHIDSRPSAAVLRDVLQQKCEYKGISVPTFAGLASQRPVLEQTWEAMLSHQLPVLPPLNDFWDALPEIFAWIAGATDVPQRAFIQHGIDEIAFRSRVLPASIPVRSRSTIEIIRFAAANHLCVDLAYDGSVRRIEPYSLRQTRDSYLVLHAIRSDTGEHRSYRVDRMHGASVTDQVFSPRYFVELTSSGPQPIAPAAAGFSTTRSRRQHGPTYIYRCPLCRKTFTRQTMENHLNPHKTPQGYPCSGRNGIYVRTSY
jgi:predicted nucleotidyltransferase component of viral defense system